MNIADIQTWARFKSDTDSTSYPDAKLLIAENIAYEEVVGKIMGADGRWQFDDTNYTDLPIGTTNLVSGQQDYQLSTQLKILSVSVKDVDGIWSKLLPFDPADLESSYGPQMDKAEFMKTSGMPLYYDLSGGSVFLYPAPDNGVSVTLTAGLKVAFQRTASVFTSAEVTTGTKQPGFASQYHVLIPLKAALAYCQNYKKDRVPSLMQEIAVIEQDMIRFYSRRNKDERQILTMRPINFR